MDFRNIGWVKVLVMVSLLVLAPVICLGSGRLLLVCNDGLNAADVIIVLGYPAQYDGRPSRTMRARVQRGVDVYLGGYAPRLLFTGGAVRNNFIEAEVMANLAIELGASPDAIIKETQSRNTVENAQFVADIMRKHRWQSAIIVTSPYHTQRAVRLFRNKGLNVVGCVHPPTSNWLVQIYEVVYEIIVWVWYLFADLVWLN